MTRHAAPDLWTAEDAMPSCTPCLDGNHAACRDLMWDERYGLHACGCGNVAHEDGAA